MPSKAGQALGAPTVQSLVIGAIGPVASFVLELGNDVGEADASAALHFDDVACIAQ